MNLTDLNHRCAESFRNISYTLTEVAEMFFDPEDGPFQDLMRCSAECEQRAAELDPPKDDPYRALCEAPDVPDLVLDAPDMSEPLPEPDSEIETESA